VAIRICVVQISPLLKIPEHIRGVCGSIEGLLKCGILFLDVTFREYKVLWTSKIRSDSFVENRCVCVI
jgi:hypothetical protein